MLLISLPNLGYYCIGFWFFDRFLTDYVLPNRAAISSGRRPQPIGILANIFFDTEPAACRKKE
jgi:hypothetical protein